MEGNKGGEWDNCNSIINKIYFLKKKKEEMHMFGPHPRPAESEALGVGPINLCSNKPGRELRCLFKVKVLWSFKAQNSPSLTRVVRCFLWIHYFYITVLLKPPHHGHMMLLSLLSR